MTVHMRIAGYLATILLLVSPACGQNSVTPEITDVSVVTEGTDARVEVRTSGRVDSPGAIAEFPDHIVLDIPGMTYHDAPRRVAVKRDDIKAVRVWLESKDPLLSRVIVELAKPEHARLSVEGDTIVLHFPGISGAVATPAVGDDAASAKTDERNSATEEGKQDTAEDVPQVGGAAPAEDTQLVAVTANTEIRNGFQVKYVEQETAYLDAGRSSGLTEGMKLIVKEKSGDGEAPGGAMLGGTVAELTVVGVAETSAVTEIHAAKRDLVAGDTAYLSAEDLQGLVQQHALGTTRKYPAVVSFTEGGDALDEEARAEVPKPPPPSVNRARGRIGFDYTGTRTLDTPSVSSSNLGMVLRADVTRIKGTYWNLEGFWRGRLTSQSSTVAPTLQDLLNRTYHLSLTYDNPNSNLVAGVGRLYLPWASSLDTIDGGYFGRRVHSGVILGVFGGSTPDPTSWSYSPGRQIAGGFMNAEGGSYDSTHYSSTTGFGVSMLKWQIDRPFTFLENSVSYKRAFSFFQAAQIDSPSGNAAVAAPGLGLGSSFLTARISPHPRIQFDINHTYFRGVPTFDPTLIGTGLLDKYLFQGFSAGARVEVVKQISVYADLGRSNRSGDASTSLNKLFGVAMQDVPWLHVRADAHYSRFNSSFGDGSYRAFSLSRSFREGFRLDVLAGEQSFISALAGNQTARFVTTTVDTSLGPRMFFQGGFTLYRGQSQNYNQWYSVLGYRFDNRWARR